MSRQETNDLIDTLEGIAYDLEKARLVLGELTDEYFAHNELEGITAAWVLQTYRNHGIMADVVDDYLHKTTLAVESAKASLYATRNAAC